MILVRDPKGTIAPQNGTAEEAYVKEHMRAAGYTGVNSLFRDNAGTWHALAYKGPVLALQAYGNVQSRAFQDIDLLVRLGDFQRVRSALLASGYRSPTAERGSSYPVMFLLECDETLVHVTFALVVELH